MSKAVPEKCPNCGFIIPVAVKIWNMKTWKGDPEIAYYYICPNCGKSFRLIKSGKEAVHEKSLVEKVEDLHGDKQNHPFFP